MIAAIIGLLLGLIIGAGCRLFDIPSPAPPRLIGACLLLAMTVGFAAIAEPSGWLFTIDRVSPSNEERALEALIDAITGAWASRPTIRPHKSASVHA